jgi:hypothetical protein
MSITEVKEKIYSAIDTLPENKLWAILSLIDLKNDKSEYAILSNGHKVPIYDTLNNATIKRSDEAIAEKDNGIILNKDSNISEHFENKISRL